MDDKALATLKALSTLTATVGACSQLSFLAMDLPPELSNIAMQLHDIANNITATVDVLAPAVGGTVEDVFASLGLG